VSHTSGLHLHKPYKQALLNDTRSQPRLWIPELNHSVSGRKRKSLLKGWCIWLGASIKYKVTKYMDC